MTLLSAGIVFWEILTRCVPYFHLCKHLDAYHAHYINVAAPDTLENSELLLKKVASGERPLIPQWMPHFWVELLQDSWNPVASKRRDFVKIAERLSDRTAVSLPHDLHALQCAFRTEAEMIEQLRAVLDSRHCSIAHVTRKRID